MCSLFIKGNTSVLEHCSLSDNWPLKSCTINLRYLTQCPGRNDRLCRTCWTSYRKMKILALQTSVEFLDLKISLHNNNLCMDLHRKDTATNSLLHYESFHPQHLKSGIPVGQFIQVKRNCTLQSDFRKNALDLTQRFRDRNYPRKIVSKAFCRARDTPRMDLLKPKPPRTNSQLGVCTRYYKKGWNSVREILAKNWNILHSDHRLKPFLDRKPKLIARRAPNLKDQLSRSHFTRPTVPLGRGLRIKGSYPCGFE